MNENRNKLNFKNIFVIFIISFITKISANVEIEGIEREKKSENKKKLFQLLTSTGKNQSFGN
jgi:hypothetical protein